MKKLFLSVMLIALSSVSFAEEPQHLCTLPGVMQCLNYTAAECNSVQATGTELCIGLIQSGEFSDPGKSEDELLLMCVLGMLSIGSGVDEDTSSACFSRYN